MNKDTIYRQDAIDTLNTGAEMLKRVLDDMYVVGNAREKYEWGLGLIESLIDSIKELPSVEPEILACGEGELSAQPERKGNWVGIDDEPCETFECDRCGFVLEDWIQGAFYNFCPNCGADMRGEEE